MRRIEFNEVAQADLLRLDKSIRDRILKFLRERVATHPAPEQIAEPLAGEFQGLHRFRVGDYRIVIHIRKSGMTIMVVFLDHRSKVYKRRELPSDFKFEANEEEE